MRYISVFVLILLAGCATPQKRTDLEVLKQLVADLSAVEPILAPSGAPEGMLSREQLEARGFRRILQRRLRELEKEQSPEPQNDPDVPPKGILSREQLEARRFGSRRQEETKEIEKEQALEP